MIEGFIAAIFMGLAGSGHCIGMCGGIAAALGHQQSSTLRITLFNVSRVASYAIIAGLLGGGIGAIGGDLKTMMPALRLVAGVLLVAMGLYLLDWWRGIQLLERGGAILWRGLQPISRRLMGQRSISSTIALGLLWGFLPCGLVYTALSWAVAYSGDSNAAWLMLGFGIGTLPSMLAASFAGAWLQKLFRQRSTKLLVALSMILFGLWTAAMPIMKMLAMGHQA
jgi:sulfite exporter TauE/SafE